MVFPNKLMHDSWQIHTRPSTTDYFLKVYMPCMICSRRNSRYLLVQPLLSLHSLLSFEAIAQPAGASAPNQPAANCHLHCRGGRNSAHEPPPCPVHFPSRRDAHGGVVLAQQLFVLSSRPLPPVNGLHSHRPHNCDVYSMFRTTHGIMLRLPIHKKTSEFQINEHDSQCLRDSSKLSKKSGILSQDNATVDNRPRRPSG